MSFSECAAWFSADKNPVFFNEKDQELMTKPLVQSLALVDHDPSEGQQIPLTSPIARQLLTKYDIVERVPYVNGN